MTIEKAIEVLKKECYVFNTTLINTALDTVIETLEQELRWIPVSERLPKAGEYEGDVDKNYLVQNEYGDMMVARYTHSEYWEQIFQTNPIADEIVAQIVIDIKKREREYLNKLVENGDQLGHYERLLVNGTPLPIGHGRLIDTDALGEKLHRYTEAPYQYALAVFNESPTIIEADKESEE